MSAVVTDAPAVTKPRIETVPVREVLPWALFGGFVLLFLVYLVGVDQGAVSVFHGTFVHEFVHDARHLLGFPCH